MRELLIYLSYIYKGDYNKIKKAIENKEDYTKEVILNKINEIKSHVVTILDKTYPKQLLELKDPPFVLYYYGDLNLVNLDCISMIGMRQCSEYGTLMAKYFSKELSDCFVVVSGMAKGIDAICHLHAKKTIAVLGCGIDYCYPKENEQIYTYIKENGLIISEYPALTPPKPYYFPFRNRIVAALGLGVIVVEAKKKSGTMITVGYALDLGRMVFAVPSRITDYSGTNSLIKEGAFCLESPNEVIEELKIMKTY